MLVNILVYLLQVFVNVLCENSNSNGATGAWMTGRDKYQWFS